METRKVRVGVIFGGRSGEHEVSLMSAQSVMDALDRAKYEVIPIGIDKNGRWLSGDPMAALTGGQQAQAATLLPDPQSSSLMQVEQGETQPATLSAVSELDVIFPVLHGTYGEDGTVQGLLELAGIPYVGAGVVGSAVGMDKAIFKYVMAANDIPIVPWKVYTGKDWAQRPLPIMDEIEAELGYPVFVKPANLGSSVGISKCDGRDNLARGMSEAARYDRRIVVEKGINGRELEVAVLGNETPEASIVGEIRPRREFYDYFAKYMAEPDSEDESELIIPAELTPEQSDAVRALAIHAYKAIDCGGLGRVDLMLDRDNGRFYMNEINTIPGFTRISMYPKLWEATGVSYAELLDKLIDLALDRYEDKSGLSTTFEIS